VTTIGAGVFIERHDVFFLLKNEYHVKNRYTDNKIKAEIKTGGETNTPQVIVNSTKKS
jgi:hypothetical protein